MKMLAFLSAVVWGVGLLLALHGAPMVSARHNWHAPQIMFVFGDSFVDSGNVTPLEPKSEMYRQWYYPYGISNNKGKATGRFSDFLVQSDFVGINAKMLGLPLSPPTYESTHENPGYCSPAGMNYAFGTTGVFEVSAWINLREQVDYFKRMVKSGTISKNHITHSVALVASSANDYKHFGIRRNPHDNSEFIRNVTTEIATNVQRLQNLGVKRILVNNLHPLGCTPSFSRARSYKVCNDARNKDSIEHNSYLEENLGKKKGVLIVDLHTAFDNIMGQRNHDLAEDSESSYNQFNHKRKPCCEAIHPKGFCGQKGENSEPLYSLCKDPSKYFFWDDAHPTHAGWEAVMKQIRGPIKEFLGIV